MGGARGAGRNNNGAGAGGAVCRGQKYPVRCGLGEDNTTGTSTSVGGATGMPTRATATRLSGATARSTVAALNAEPLRATSGASNGAVA